MLPFHEVVADDFNAVNQRIIEQLHSDVGLVENIGHYPNTEAPQALLKHYLEFVTKS